MATLAEQTVPLTSDMHGAQTEALEEFKRGLTLLRNRYPEEALQHIRNAAEMETSNPFYLSYLGLTLAMARKKWADASRLCESALRLKRGHPQLYLNLADVYIQAGRKEDAVDTLTAGLRYNSHDVRLRTILGKLGVRRPPVLSFMDRGHIINRSLGRIRNGITKLAGNR